MTIARAIAATTLWAAASTAGAQAPADFAQRQPLATAAAKAFQRIELPDSVYDGAGRPDLGDLRVFNADGGLVPYAFMPRPAPVAFGAPRRPLAFFPLTVDTTRPEAGDLSINVRRDAAGTTVDVRSRDGTPVSGTRVVGYLVDAGADAAPLVALVLPLPAGATVNARLRIDASDDLGRWRTVVADAPLLSLEFNGRRLTRDRIELPPLQARYLRITWLAAAGPELTAVEGAVGDRIVERPRRVRKAPGTADGEAFVFDLGAALPVDRLTLELPEVNTVTPIVWEARVNVQDKWRYVGAAVAYRLRGDAGESVDAGYALAATTIRYVRARLDPKAGGVGATPPTLAAAWYPQEIVFAARGNDPFELAYGSRTAAPVALSMATLVPGYVPGKPLPDNVGTAALSATPSAINRSALRDPLDVKRWLLWGTLVAASLLLGYMALRLSRQMRANDEHAKR
jgi:hypothetical protein